MWVLHTVQWLLSHRGLIRGSRYAGKPIISLIPVDKIKVMDMLTITLLPPPLFLFSPPCCWSTLALQVQISCCLLQQSRAKLRPFDWLNFHSSTKGKNAFLLMINDCSGDKSATYMGFISTGGFCPSLFSCPPTLSLSVQTLIKGFMSSDWLHALTLLDKKDLSEAVKSAGPVHTFYHTFYQIKITFKVWKQNKHWPVPKKSTS